VGQQASFTDEESQQLFYKISEKMRLEENNRQIKLMSSISPEKLANCN